MPILQGQDLQNYLQWKQSGQVQAPQKSLPESILSGVLDPFAKSGRMLSELQTSGARMGESARSGEGYNPGYMSGQELESWKANPLLETAKPLAGMAAWAVPGAGVGAGLGAKLGLGAAGGALGGFGASEGGDLESVLGDTLTGAGMGAGTAGLFHGGGKALGKFKGSGVGKSLQKNVFKGLKASKVKMTPAKFGDVQEEILKEMAQNNLTVNTSHDLVNNIPSLFSKYDDELLAATTKAAPLKGSKKVILGNILEKHGDDTVKMFKSPQMNRLQKTLNGLSDDPTTRELIEVNQLIDEIGGDFKGVMTSSVREKKQLLKAIRGDVRGELAKSSQVDKILTKQSNVMKVKDELGKAIEKGTGARAYGLGVNVRNPIESVTSRLGRAGGLPQGLQNILGSNAMTQFGQKAAPILGAQQMVGGGGSVLPQMGDTSLLGPLGGQQMPPLGMAAPQGGMPEGFKQQLAMQVLSGEIDPAQAKMAMELIGTGAGGGGSPVMRGIDQLEQLYGVGTPMSLSAGSTTTGIGGLLGKGSQALKGSFDQDFQDRLTQYNSMAALAIGPINKAREAGTLNEGEAQQMLASMPGPNTSEAAAQAWFRNVRIQLGGGGMGSPEPQLGQQEELMFG